MLEICATSKTQQCDPSPANVPILYPLKTLVFMGYKMSL